MRFSIRTYAALFAATMSCTLQSQIFAIEVFGAPPYGVNIIHKKPDSPESAGRAG
jgi:hypothetical protein